MIKKVVEESKKEAGLFFSSGKIYMAEDQSGCLWKLQLKNDRFSFEALEGTHVNLCGTYGSFEEIISFVCGNRIHRTCRSKVYVLNNQLDLARLIMGCRDFPPVEPVMVKELGEDEISVDNNYFATNKIYACCHEEKVLVATQEDSGVYSFRPMISRQGNRYTGAGNHENLTKLITCFNGFTAVYQFDTQEEFFRWSLGQVTGKGEINEK